LASPPPPSELQPAPAEPRAKTALERERVLIRAYPKTIFFYPTMLVSFLCATLSPSGLVGLMLPGSQIVAPQTLGFCFTAVFLVNLIVVSFEFRRSASVILTLLALVAVLAAVLLNRTYGVFDFLGRIYALLDFVANAQFYLAIGFSFAAVIAGLLLAARLDYWEVRGNEVIHHTGLLGDTERYPAPSLTVKTEVTDVFEFLLLRSGRLIIYPSGREKAIVLDNVPLVHTVEKRMEDLLRTLKVTVDPQS
jgi:hypothetical protein